MYIACTTSPVASSNSELCSRRASRSEPRDGFPLRAWKPFFPTAVLYMAKRIRERHISDKKQRHLTAEGLVKYKNSLLWKTVWYSTHEQYGIWLEMWCAGKSCVRGLCRFSRLDKIEFFISKAFRMCFHIDIIKRQSCLN